LISSNQTKHLAIKKTNKQSSWLTDWLTCRDYARPARTLSL
jgi:hypothetical protein